MSDAAERQRRFVIIGENIHTTRVFMRKGKRIVTAPDGYEAISYVDGDGATQYLRIPDKIKQTQDYEEGRVKHVAIAVRHAMATEGEDAAEGRRYLQRLVERQDRAGAHYLDINVDEISIKPGEQQAAMRWLVEFLRAQTATPLSIDSSNSDTIRIGLEAWSSGAAGNGSSARGMLNSVSLERLAALDLVTTHDVSAIVTAAGASGMPENAEQRVTNASQVIDAALERGIALGDLYVDPLVFPISVDQSFGNDCLDAIRTLRDKYGPDIHISGGFSNVSFGMPARRLINDVFLILAVAAGADSGIIDPVTSNLERTFGVDRDSHRYRLAEDLLQGRDEYCATFIRAHRKGELVGDG